jgi:hypothetical protein
MHLFWTANTASPTASARKALEIHPINQIVNRVGFVLIKARN